MEVIIFATLVLTYHIWLPFFLQVFLFFVPDSWYHEPSVEDSTAPLQPSVRRKAYVDPTPDPFADLQPSQERRANQFMSAEAKQAYLHSFEWRTLRQQVLLRDNYACQSCGAKQNLEVHHITYEQLGKEKLTDLVALCSKCHNHVHNELGYDRQTIFDFSTLKMPK